MSAGNTGALMAISKMCLKTIAGIHRPAIISILPTEKDYCVMLDLGANTDCDAVNLVEFAVMGVSFAKAILGKERPTVGLLNIGSEEMKGKEEIRQAAQAIKDRITSYNVCYTKLLRPLYKTDKINIHISFFNCLSSLTNLFFALHFL